MIKPELNPTSMPLSRSNIGLITAPVIILFTYKKFEALTYPVEERKPQISLHYMLFQQQVVLIRPKKIQPSVPKRVLTAATLRKGDTSSSSSSSSSSKRVIVLSMYYLFEAVAVSPKFDQLPTCQARCDRGDGVRTAAKLTRRLIQEGSGRILYISGGKLAGAWSGGGCRAPHSSYWRFAAVFWGAPSAGKSTAARRTLDG
jgi:hypothetical protein